MSSDDKYSVFYAMLCLIMIGMIAYQGVLIWRLP